MPYAYRIGRRVYRQDGTWLATFASEFDASEYVAGVNDQDIRIERAA